MRNAVNIFTNRANPKACWYNEVMLKKSLVIVTVSALACIMVPARASAAKPATQAVREPIGYDISWPQCGKKLPTGQAFAIVGVNGGTAANTNPCLAEQLLWANKSLGGTGQPKIQLYVNTANPGEVISQISTWPTNNTDATGYTPTNPHGQCSGANDMACSWQYGWNRAVQDYHERFLFAALLAKVPTSINAYTWWLDVETMNTWQSGSPEALARNAATLEAMTSYFTQNGAKVGLYSTAYQWGVIVGQSVGPASNLNNLPNWRPSGSSLSNAKANCSLAPLTNGGFMSMTQYVQQGLDKNYSCI